jgi:mRNA interferase HigB
MRTSGVLILGREHIDGAIKKHSDWKASLNSWFQITTGARWKNFSDVRMTFSNASWVNRKVVFNIAHNKARLISQVVFEKETVAILHILSHKEYDEV